MPNPDLAKARTFFERSERENDPSRKFAALEEAIELVDLVLEDQAVSQSDSDLALNVRRSHIRRLLAQLVNMRSIEGGIWWNYIQLLLIEREDDVEAILAADAGLSESYQAFIDIWKDELFEALERARLGLSKKHK